MLAFCGAFKTLYNIHKIVKQTISFMCSYCQNTYLKFRRVCVLTCNLLWVTKRFLVHLMNLKKNVTDIVSPPYTIGMSKGGDRFVVVLLHREKLPLTEQKFAVYVYLYRKNCFFTFSILKLIFWINIVIKQQVKLIHFCDNKLQVCSFSVQLVLEWAWGFFPPCLPVCAVSPFEGAQELKPAGVR